MNIKHSNCVVDFQPFGNIIPDMLTHDIDNLSFYNSTALLNRINELTT